MKADIEKFDSGWIGVSLSLAPHEIDLLVDRLKALRAGEVGHFHVRQNRWGPSPGVADIEFSLAEPADNDELTIE